MAIASARDSSREIPYEQYVTNRREAARKQDSDEEESLTPEESNRLKLMRYLSNQYDEARQARAPFDTFDIAWDLFIGNVWPNRWPTWRAKITINKIRAFITFMQAIMTDNKPRISVEPTVPGSEDAADLLRKLVDRDWDENDMQNKLSIFVLYGLIWGTAFFKVTYNTFANGGLGKHLAEVVVPYRVYTNKTATNVDKDGCEYIIHVEDMTMGWIRRNYPDKANLVYKMHGQRSRDSQREQMRDFIREGDTQEQQRIITAQNVNGNITGPQFSSPNPQYHENDGETVEVREHWFTDDTLEQYERQKIENGVLVTEPDLDEEGLYQFEQVGIKVHISEIDEAIFNAPVYKVKTKPVMEYPWRLKYPNGRLALIAANRVLLCDIANPFQCDGFPWAMWKDYDVGTIWGQGECLAQKDMQVASNRIISQVYDILEKTGNPSYKLKKGAGVNAQTIKNRPGQIIPMDEMDALAPLEKPQIPGEFFTLFGAIQKGMSEVAGINEAVMGGVPANTAFATVDQLTESSAAPIRLKVRNLESGIARIGKIRVQLIQQFDNGKKPIRLTPEEFNIPDGTVQPAAESSVQFRQYTNPDLQGQVDFSIVPISSLSTSPASVWNKWITLYDKHLIDRAWWHRKNRIEGWKSELGRMELQEAQDAAREAAAKPKGKPGPAPTRPAKQARRKPAPPSNLPSRLENASIR